MRQHIPLILLAICICVSRGYMPRSKIEKLFKVNETTTPQPSSSCTALQEEWSWESSVNGMAFVKQNDKIILLWDETMGRAAAALMRATLIAAGYNANEITLQERRGFKHQDGLKNQILVVEVKMAAQLHIRLTPRAYATPSCNSTRMSWPVPHNRSANVWSIQYFLNTQKYVHGKNMELLQKCDFLLSELRIPKQLIVYILYEWEHTCAAEAIRQLAANEYSWIDVVYLDRSQLTQFILESDRSFFFLDVDNWHGFFGVQIYSEQVETKHCALAQQKEVSFIFHDEVSNAFETTKTFTAFSPNLTHLNDIIQLSKHNYSIQEAACEWAQEHQIEITPWRQAAVVKPALRVLAVLVCKVEVQDLNEYSYLKALMKMLTNITFKQEIQIQVFYVDCFDSDWLLRKLFNWFSKNFLSQIAGVVLTEDIAIAAAPLAEKFQLPLLTYDVSSDSIVRSATGRVKHLEQALRRLLVGCKWRRLAILSDQTRLARALSAALRTPTAGLLVREANVTVPSNSNNVRQVLEELLAADARVFMVNTGAATAATVLAIAKELNMTWDRGYTWIVREYNAADNATSIIRPYSVSFWLRGYSIEKDKEGEVIKYKRRINKSLKWFSHEHNNTILDDLRINLETKWQGRAWPLHAAPIVDAILTIAEGLKRVETYQQTTLFHARKDTIRKFWNVVQQKNISGIVEDLSYDEFGVSAPLVFVQQWSAEPRPQLLATWRSGEWREPGETCPATDPYSDGSIHCFIPAGDSFQPSCRDAVWITSISFALIVTVAIFVLVIHRTRQALIARDQRVKTEYAKRLLERRERVFAALAEHLVERSQLELFQEIGKGRFGRVYHGVLRQLDRKRKNLIVAAKTLREDAAPAEENEFLREACMLSQFDHEHVVRFLGICITDGPPLILMEHAFFGDLLRYLQSRRYLADEKPSTEETSTGVGLDEKAYVSAEALTRLAYEAASALAYIAQRGIVHRDIRASNCLVDERRSLKLADFGLARATGTVDGEYACRRGLFPVLWMAPESLATGVSTVASDVWSFGVLVFELVTLGRRPYGSEPPPSVLRRVLAGGRPQLPWDASAETRALVRACWRHVPETRPTAARLADWLSTRWRALRPALVTEFVDIESHVYGNNDADDLDLDCSTVLK